MSTPWVERPILQLDGTLPFKHRFQVFDEEVRFAASRLLEAISREIPDSASRLASPVRLRTANRFHTECVALAREIGATWKQVLLANISYDLMLFAFGCSTVALPTKEGPVLARNMDWWPEDVLAQVSYLIKTEIDGKLKFANAGWPGAVGVVTGMSGNGFAVALNAVAGVEPPDKRGYPVLLHLRRVIEDARNFDHAVELLQQQRLVVSGLLTVVGTENHQRVVIERSPNQAALRWGESGKALVTTNNYQLLGQTSPPMGMSGHQAEIAAGLYESTCSRYEALCEYFRKGMEDRIIPDDYLLSILSEPDVIQQITAQQIIMRPRSQQIRLFVPKSLLS